VREGPVAQMVRALC